VQYCFDTSAINRLHDDPEREPLVDGLLAVDRVVIVGLNIIEAAVTEKVERRLSLLRLQQRLSNNDRPLRIPTQIVQHLTRAYVQKLNAVDIAIDNTEGHQLWWVLHEPESLDEEMRQEAYQWKKKLETSFSEVHQDAREEMRNLFTPRPKSLGQLFQFHCKNPQSFLPSASKLYEEISGTPLDEQQLRDLFRDIPEWPLYLAGWAQGMYARAIQDSNFSPRKNPGTIDLWFAVHLAHCDALVTDDAGQYKALRVINALGERRRKRACVLSYEQFRKRVRM
jgi:predicted nucleic acid-binding protein